MPDSITNASPIWIHAVSVGEAVASAAVVSEIKRQLPGVPVVISTTTQTGQEMAKRTVTDADAFFYYPIDFAPCVVNALRRVRPGLFASIDTELWPNFRFFARKFHIPSVMANGTLSDHTMQSTKRFPGFYRWILSNIDAFYVQSPADEQRMLELGVDSDKVVVFGNCKADQFSEPLSEDVVVDMRQSYCLSESDRVFVAGSTNPGEDEPVIDAFLEARKTFTTLKLIVAPRQIDRKDEIAALVKSKGLVCAWKSAPSTIALRSDVIILDTLGELANVYVLADVTFVGGTLIPKGGHSILQPIIHGKPVLFGQYTFKTRDIARQSMEYGVGFEVSGSKDMADRIVELLSDRALIKRIRLAGAEMIAANRGAAQRTAEALVKLYQARKA